MARLDPDDFDDRDLARIFMTPKLGEARRAEAALAARGIDFVVVAEPFGRTLFGLPRTGASFFVAAEQADLCAEVLAAAGLSRGIVGPDTDHDAPQG
ncbi:MAG: hypothetical protein IT184_12085 [Acidobacteria bacterium]|nr:hypothetical protein [Acidobacteriota bacterium]